jgi:hypothetical protein
MRIERLSLIPQQDLAMTILSKEGFFDCILLSSFSVEPRSKATRIAVNFYFCFG